MRYIGSVFKVIGFIVVLIGFLFLISVLYTILRWGASELTFEFFDIRVIVGLGMVAIGIVAISVQSKEKSRKFDTEVIINAPAITPLVTNHTNTLAYGHTITTTEQVPPPPPPEINAPDITNRYKANNKFNYSLFIFGAVLIAASLFLMTYNQEQIVTQFVSYGIGSLDIPTAVQVQPYQPIGIGLLIFSLLLCGYALYQIKVYS